MLAELVSGDLGDLDCIDSLTDILARRFKDTYERLPEVRCIADWDFEEITEAEEIRMTIVEREKRYADIGITTSNMFDIPPFPGGIAEGTRYFKLSYKRKIYRAARLIRRNNGLYKGEGIIPLDLNLLNDIDLAEELPVVASEAKQKDKEEIDSKMSDEDKKRVKFLLDKYPKSSTFELSGFVGFPLEEEVEEKKRTEIESAFIAQYCMAYVHQQEKDGLFIYTQHPSHAKFYRDRTGLPFIQVIKNTYSDHYKNPAETLCLRREVTDTIFELILNKEITREYLQASKFKPKSNLQFSLPASRSSSLLARSAIHCTIP